MLLNIYFFSLIVSYIRVIVILSCKKKKRLVDNFHSQIKIRARRKKLENFYFLPFFFSSFQAEEKACICSKGCWVNVNHDISGRNTSLFVEHEVETHPLVISYRGSCFRGMQINSNVFSCVL